MSVLFGEVVQVCFIISLRNFCCLFFGKCDAMPPGGALLIGSFWAGCNPLPETEGKM